MVVENEKFSGMCYSYLWKFAIYKDLKTFKNLSRTRHLQCNAFSGLIWYGNAASMVNQRMIGISMGMYCCYSAVYQVGF